MNPLQYLANRNIRCLNKFIKKQKNTDYFIKYHHEMGYVIIVHEITKMTYFWYSEYNYLINNRKMIGFYRKDARKLTL